mmetsp:Transcript_19945/g.24642  ORF Transcript_19945/g.24642 Transcript_19945/m.24642 type:complete len:168 (+) Transcript_19945:156-659(+)
MVSRTQTFCGTLEYMAPEMMENKNYTTSVDWFSFGILLFEMLSGKNPLKNERQETCAPEDMPMRMNEILKDGTDFLKVYEDKDTFSPPAYDLLEKLLRFDPEFRIGCRDLGVLEIKQHPFFSDIDWDLIERKGLEAPFKPDIKHGAADISNFEAEFTNMPLVPSPVN